MSQYRAFAKAVAIFDMVIASISIFGIIILVILAGTAASVAKDVSLHQIPQLSGSGYRPSSSDPATGFGGLVHAAIWLLCAIVVLCAALAALQMWAAIRLLSATEIGREPVEALRLASTWRNVSIVFLVLEIITFMACGMYITFAVTIFLRGGMIYIVFRYMGELEMIITSVPVSVTIQK